MGKLRYFLKKRDGEGRLGYFFHLTVLILEKQNILVDKAIEKPGRPGFFIDWQAILGC